MITRRAWMLSTVAAFAAKPRYERYDPGQLPAPALILLPGAGGPNSPRFPCRRYASVFRDHGFVVFVTEFRSGGTRGQLNDALAAVDYVSGQPGVSGATALVGFSQGGSIALLAASQRRKVRAVVAWAGNLPDDFYQGVIWLPPTLLIHGSRDAVIPLRDAEQVIRLCGIRKLPCEISVLKGESHGFSRAGEPPALEQTVSFLRRHAGLGAE